jgi:outer membrane biogenesis lipoprotein LolB
MGTVGIIRTNANYFWAWQGKEYSIIIDAVFSQQALSLEKCLRKNITNEAEDLK